MPRFDVIDSDLLLWETPSAPVMAVAPLRIAGADHALIWSNAALVSSRAEFLARSGDEGYFGYSDGRVVAISLSTGQSRWSYQNGDAQRRVGFQYGRIADDGDLYLGGWVRWSQPQQDARLLMRLDTEHGTLRWAHQAERRNGGSASAASVLDVAGDHVLFADSIATTRGCSRWRWPMRRRPPTC